MYRFINFNFDLQNANFQRQMVQMEKSAANRRYPCLLVLFLDIFFPVRQSVNGGNFLKIKTTQKLKFFFFQYTFGMVKSTLISLMNVVHKLRQAVRVFLPCLFLFKALQQL